MRAREFITEAAYDSMVVAMKQQFPDQVSYIDQWVRWAKTSFQKADRVMWFLKILRADLAGTLGEKELGRYPFSDIQKLATDIQHFYGIDYPPIHNYTYKNQSVGTVIDDLSGLEAEWHFKQRETQGVTPQEKDYKLFEFSDGTAWWWVDRAYCEEEGRSGKHCGNITGLDNPNQRILSLRNSKDQVICTFILEPDNTLGEMKAKANQKPNAKYHPQILKLLMWDRIKGIAPTAGQYRPEANFNVFDLSDKQVNYLDQNKPEMLVSQIQSMPSSALRMPDSLKEKYLSVLESVKPALVKVFFNGSDDDWAAAVQEDPELIIYAPTTIDNWENSVIEAVSEIGGLLARAPEHISKNYQLVNKIISVEPILISEVNPNIPKYESLCFLAIRGSTFAVMGIPEEHLTLKMCQQAVRQYGQVITDLPERFITADLYIEAIKDDIRILGNAAPGGYAPVPTSDLPKLYDAAMDISVQAIEFIPEKYITYDKSLRAVKENGELLEFVPKEYRDKKLSAIAFRNTPKAFPYIPPGSQTEEMQIQAVSYNSRYARYIKDTDEDTREKLRLINLSQRYDSIDSNIDRALPEDQLLLRYPPLDIQQLMLKNKSLALRFADNLPNSIVDEILDDEDFAPIWYEINSKYKLGK